MGKKSGQAIARIIEVVAFENWLRFYFIAESENKDLMLLIPEQSVQKIKELYPHLAPLAQRMNNTLITHESSMREVCLFIASELDGGVFSESLMQQVFMSDEFQLESQLFGTWVQTHEEQLDSTFSTFSQWQKEFTTWRESDAVQKHIKSIEKDLAHAATVGSNAVH